MYVYIDAPGVLGVLYMYVCMHVCMHYVCMYLCTLFSMPIGAPDGIDGVSNIICMYYDCLHVSTRWENYFYLFISIYL